ncbi:MAG: hypothetical protein VX833_03325 [Actinomycetota bacterium]|nr:hypothetical protein [Actinomycetota bacterium]
MAAPSYVPNPAVPSTEAIYTSPRRRLGTWRADRAGEVESAGRDLQGASLGHPGPDQGYVLRLVRLFEPQLRLAEGERRSDVVAGVVAVALKRASLCGRAPVAEDLRVAFDLFGFLSDASEELIARRRELFDGAAGHHNYRDVRRIVDLVPVSALQVGVDSPSA